MARAALWSACAFVLNLAWEIAQVRLYTVWAEADGPGIFRALPPAIVASYRALAPLCLAGAALSGERSTG